MAVCELCGRGLSDVKAHHFHIEHTTVPAKRTLARTYIENADHYYCQDCIGVRTGILERVFDLPPEVCDAIYRKIISELGAYERRVKNGTHSL